MSKLGKIKKIFNLPLVATHLCMHWPFNKISDERFLKYSFRAYQDRKLDLENPKSFNEKLQWLKIYDRKDEYTTLTDKYLVREYVKEKIGEKYLIPLLGVWDNAKDIDFDSLPDEFVLKCNHDSGSVVICKDKKTFDKKKAIKKLNKALEIQYFRKSREWNYKNIERKIIAERLMKNNDGEQELTDYKYFCFDGEPKFIQVDTGRFTDHVRNFYDPDWNFIDVKNGCKNDSSIIVPEPKQHKEMLELARKLSLGMAHVRVDFYISNEEILFGELTFHHGGGFMKVEPYEYDLKWGEYLKLPKVK